MNEFDLVNKIVDEKNIIELFKLNDNSAFSIGLHKILINKYEKDPNSLNDKQLNLFLCMHLENAGQADSILSFLQEWYPNYVDKIVNSLKEIGATESAKIIEKAINLLPTDGSWFFDNSSESDVKLMSSLDTKFSNYPDGPSRELYRRYAVDHKEEIIN